MVKRPNDMESNWISENNTPIYKTIKYCSFNALFEQSFQRQFFKQLSATYSLEGPICVLLPPKNYQWPSKHVKLPVPPGESAIPWSNLGLNSSQDVLAFNPRYTKNIYHFNASTYDIEQEKLVNVAAKYIPFGKKIRTMLEIGAGGGSVSFILNKRYDVAVLNTALSEFPYCEYITERGGLCTLLNGENVMPFAKFSFDVIHHSWVYHALTPARWRDLLLEQNRILRPGGYLWISDGLSNAQLKTIKFLLLQQLGYKLLFEKEIKRSSVTVTFGSNPYELEWHAILVKPNRLKKDLHQCN